MMRKLTFCVFLMCSVSIVTAQNSSGKTTYLSARTDKTVQELVNHQRNLTIGGLLTNFILVGLLYRSCRSRKRDNFELKVKQQEIIVQNNSLSSLLDEKENLLQDKGGLLDLLQDLITEKELLLKEVHHRIKNSLEIVMSLLYTQSAYLQNRDETEAITDGQNRIQAISIVYQKLYNKSHIGTIILTDYINELVRHLYTCHDCNRRGIKLKAELDSINLDVSQAVPLGLILNEAITNCIKYAFDEQGGEIFIKVYLSEAETIVVSITDNGCGLPPNFNLAETSPFGTELMKALGKQLDGSFEVRNNLDITLIFKIERN